MALEAPSLPLSQLELARWTRFAQKGGIGKGRAVADRLAESGDELMFMSGEEITILLLLDPKTTQGMPEALRSEPGIVLGYCEQVVGLVRVTDVKLTTRLKKPVISSRKRESSPQGSAGGLGIDGVSMTSATGGAGSSDSVSVSYSESDAVQDSPRLKADISSPTSSGYRTSSDYNDGRSPTASTPASSYTSPHVNGTSSLPPSPRPGHINPKNEDPAQRVQEEHVALGKPLRNVEIEPALVTPPPLAQAFSYFDVPVRGKHAPHGSVSSSVTSGGQTLAYDNLLDMYSGSPSSRASSRASTTRSPVQAMATLRRINEAVSIEQDAHTQLGQLFMDGLEDMETPSPPLIAHSHQGLLPAGDFSPQSKGQTPTPRAKTFLGETDEVTTPLAYSDDTRRSSPPLVNTAPLRTTRSHPNLAKLTISPKNTTSRFELPPDMPPSPSPRPESAASAKSATARVRAATFSEVRSAKHQPPPPVVVSPSRHHGPSFVAPPDWQSSPGLSSAGLDSSPSSSSGLSSPSQLLASPRLANAKRDLRIRTLDRASPTNLKAPGSPLASPRSPGLSPRSSPGGASSKGGPGGGSYFSPKRSTPSPQQRPSHESFGVQAVNNVEVRPAGTALFNADVAVSNGAQFEMIAPPTVLPRNSAETTGSYRRGASGELVDNDGQQSDDGGSDHGWDDAVTKASVEDRKLLRQSMIIAEAELEAAAAGLDRDGFYTQGVPAMSTESFATTSSFRSSSLALGGLGSGPPSPTDTRSLESHRSRELKWVQLMTTPLVAARKTKKLKQMVRAGLPASVRGKGWVWLADVDSLRTPGLYHELCHRDSPVHDEIDGNLSACYPPHALFASSNSPARVDLASILKAFAVFEPRVGFSRELAYVAGVMLLYVPSAEDVFWLLVAISRHLAPGLHDHDGDGLRETAFVAGHLLASVEPALAKRLVECQVDPRQWTAAWVLPLFTQTLPWATLLRILDCYFLEGQKLILRVALSLFDMMRDDLLTCPLDRMAHLVMNPPRAELEQPQTLLAAVWTTKVKDSSLRRLTRRAEVVVRQGKPRPSQ